MLATTVTLTGFHLTIGIALLVIASVVFVSAWYGGRRGSMHAKIVEEQMLNKLQEFIPEVIEGLKNEVRLSTISSNRASTNSLRALGKIEDVEAASHKILWEMCDGELRKIPHKWLDEMSNRIEACVNENMQRQGRPVRTKGAVPSKVGDLEELKRMTHMELHWQGCDLHTEESRTFENLKKHLGWITYGPNGKSKKQLSFKHILLADCDTDHLENILATCKNLDPVYVHVILGILKDRAFA